MFCRNNTFLGNESDAIVEKRAGEFVMFRSFKVAFIHKYFFKIAKTFRVKLANKLEFFSIYS